MILKLDEFVKNSFNEELYDIVIRDKMKVTKKLHLPGRPNKPLLLPLKIDINKNFLIGMGIYYGEATTASSVSNRIEVANTHPEILRILLEMFEQLGITRNSIAIQIGIYKEDAKFTDRNSLIRYWSRKLQLPARNFKTITIYHKTGNRKKAASYGTIQLRYYNSSMRIFMKYLLEYVLNMIKKDKKMCYEFFKGLMAAEGNIEVRHESLSLRSVSISCTKNKDEVFRMLRLIGLKPGKYNPRMRAIRIQGIENFNILMQNDLICTHPEKRKTFLEAIHRHRYAYRLFP